MALRRILKEYKDFEADPPTDCFLLKDPFKDGNDRYHWDVGIYCSNIDNPLYDGIFKITVDLPHDYPFKAPAIRVGSKIYHPQLWESNQKLCMSILGCNWSPALTVSKILLPISQMIQNPFSACLDCTCCGELIDENECKKRAYNNKTGATAMYFNDRKQYDKIAREWKLKYAMGLEEPVQESNENNPIEHSPNNDIQVDQSQHSVQQNDESNGQIGVNNDNNQAQSQGVGNTENDENKEEVSDEEEEEDICVRLLREWSLSQYKTVLIDDKLRCCG